MASALLYDRLQFAFTATFHYLFPQLTMGLALLLLCVKSWALATGDDHYDQVAQFWTKIFALSFAFGVVTGIPLEFQFGTNWAKFSNYAGGVIGQTLAMEGMFAFFLESSFLGILLFGNKRCSRRLQWAASLMLFLGSWLSGYFILATNAWMQHPVAYTVAPDGRLFVDSLSGLLTNPWLFWQYTHNMTAAVVTASFVMAALGAFYLLSGQHAAHAKTFLRIGVLTGAAAAARFEPHYAEIRSGDQVQIYESILGDSSGSVTTGLLSAVRYLKDNRLLPHGFDKRTADPEIAVKGEAADDQDFGGGGDRVRYSAIVTDGDGPFEVEAELLYQPIGFRWASNLKHYSAPEPRRFNGYYDAMGESGTAILARATASVH